MRTTTNQGRKTVNRRLIRPSLSEVRNQGSGDKQSHSKRKPAPPESTQAEAYYYIKQMQTKTPIVVVLNDGETLRGWIEWYDKDCIKVHRNTGPNLLLFKSCIKYLYKDEEGETEAAPEELEVAHSRGGN
jgi:sRNA-binding regulator protein Hfq